MRVALVLVALAGCGDNPGRLPACTAFDSTLASGYPVPAGPAAVVVGDIDGDGHADVVVGDGPLELFAVGPDGSLAQTGRLLLGDAELALALIDVDHDRIPEIVAVANDAIFVAKGATLYSKDPVPFPVIAAGAGDLDGDGVPELVVVGTTEVAVLHAVADGTFDLVANGDHVECQSCPTAIGDVDGDGHADVVIDSSVLLGHGDGTLDTSHVFDRGGLLSVAIGDIDGDGRPEVASVRDGLVVPVGGMGEVAQLAPEGNAMLRGVEVALPGSVHAGVVAIGDVDGDGTADLVVAYDEGPLSIASIISHGTQHAIRLSQESPVRALTLADLDGDGRLDLVETTELGVVPIKIACADAPSCASADGCPAIGECGVAACTAGACDVAAVSEGTPIAAQTTGDCQIAVCNGFGGVESAPDGSDAPDQPCRVGSCVGGIPELDIAADGTACGSNSICESGTCEQRGVLFVFDQGPAEGRVVDANGVEIGACPLGMLNCLVPAPPGAYTVEVASPWGVGQLAGACQSGSLATCDVTVANQGTVVVVSAIQPADTWVFLGDPDEAFGAAGFDAAGDVIVGSATRVVELDPTGAVAWSTALPASSIAVGTGAIYVVSGSTLVALDSAGVIQWQSPADVCPAVAFAHCLAIAPDGDIVFGGPRVMRFAPDGTLRWQSGTDPAWVDASVAVSDDDVTYLLQADAISGGVTAARFAADGTRLADFIDDATRSLGAPLASLTVDGTVVVVASSTATTQSIHLYDPTGHELHGADIASGIPHGVASAGGVIADAIRGFPDAGAGFSAFEEDGNFNGVGHSLADNATTGLAHVIGDIVEAVAVSPHDARFVVAGSYAGLGSSTVGWVEVSPGGR